MYEVHSIASLYNILHYDKIIVFFMLIQHEILKCTEYNTCFPLSLIKCKSIVVSVVASFFFIIVIIIIIFIFLICLGLLFIEILTVNIELMLLCSYFSFFGYNRQNRKIHIGLPKVDHNSKKLLTKILHIATIFFNLVIPQNLIE